MTSALDLAISKIEDEVEVIQKCVDAAESDPAENDRVVLLACLTRAVCHLVRVCAEH